MCNGGLCLVLGGGTGGHAYSAACRFFFLSAAIMESACVISQTIIMHGLDQVI